MIPLASPLVKLSLTWHLSMWTHSCQYVVFTYWLVSKRFFGLWMVGGDEAALYVPYLAAQKTTKVRGVFCVASVSSSAKLGVEHPEERSSMPIQRHARGADQ